MRTALLDAHHGLVAVAEPLDLEALVAELAVEALVEAVLPRFPSASAPSVTMSGMSRLSCPSRVARPGLQDEVAVAVLELAVRRSATRVGDVLCGLVADIPACRWSGRHSVTGESHGRYCRFWYSVRNGSICWSFGPAALPSKP